MRYADADGGGALLSCAVGVEAPLYDRPLLCGEEQAENWGTRHACVYVQYIVYIRGLTRVCMSLMLDMLL